MKQYVGAVPPCGIYCGKCPSFLKEKDPCPGAEEHCIKRKCKGIFICCKEKKGHTYCYECKSFPCSRFKTFAETWSKLGQDLIINQRELEILGEKEWLAKWKNRNSNI